MENQEELEEFNYEEVKNILFKKLKELSKGNMQMLITSTVVNL